MSAPILFPDRYQGDNHGRNDWPMLAKAGEDTAATASRAIKAFMGSFERGEKTRGAQAPLDYSPGTGVYEFPLTAGLRCVVNCHAVRRLFLMLFILIGNRDVARAQEVDVAQLEQPVGVVDGGVLECGERHHQARAGLVYSMREGDAVSSVRDAGCAIVVAGDRVPHLWRRAPLTDSICLPWTLTEPTWTCTTTPTRRAKAAAALMPGTAPVPVQNGDDAIARPCRSAWHERASDAWHADPHAYGLALTGDGKANAQQPRAAETVSRVKLTFGPIGKGDGFGWVSPVTASVEEEKLFGDGRAV